MKAQAWQRACRQQVSGERMSCSGSGWTAACLSGFRVWLKEAKHIIVLIHEVALPAASRNGKPGYHNRSTGFGNSFGCSIKVGHLHRAGEGVCARCWRRYSCGSFQQTAGDAGCFNPIVSNWDMGFANKLPTEDGLGKGYFTGRLRRLNFKITDGVHMI